MSYQPRDKTWEERSRGLDGDRPAVLFVGKTGAGGCVETDQLCCLWGRQEQRAAWGLTSCVVCREDRSSGLRGD